MARNFWGAFIAWIVCFVVTIAVSAVTKPRALDDLKGLVYSMTPRVRETGLAWYNRPAVLAVIVGVHGPRVERRLLVAEGHAFR